MKEKTIKVLVPDDSDRNPLNWCASCALRESCVTVVPNVKPDGTLLPLVAAAFCSVYREEEK